MVLLLSLAFPAFLRPSLDTQVLFLFSSLSRESPRRLLFPQHPHLLLSVSRQATRHPRSRDHPRSSNMIVLSSVGTWKLIHFFTQFTANRRVVKGRLSGSEWFSESCVAKNRFERWQFRGLDQSHTWSSRDWQDSSTWYGGCTFSLEIASSLSSQTLDCLIQFATQTSKAQLCSVIRLVFIHGNAGSASVSIKRAAQESHELHQLYIAEKLVVVTQQEGVRTRSRSTESWRISSNLPASRKLHLHTENVAAANEIHSTLPRVPGKSVPCQQSTKWSC